MRALLLVIERRFDDDDDDDAAASEMGELFSTTKAKSLSLSFSRAQNTQPRVCEKNFFIPLYENEEASL